MSSDILFMSYLPIYRETDDLSWILNEYSILFQVVFPGRDIWDAQNGYTAASELLSYAHAHNLIGVYSSQLLMDAYLRALLAVFNSRMDIYYYNKPGAERVQINHGQYCEADENMGVAYYKVGCTMPRWLAYDIAYREKGFPRFLSQRVKKKRVYRFLKDPVKADPLWWREPSRWTGFDMGLMLDFFLHMFCNSRRILRRSGNFQWLVTRELIGNKELRPSDYLSIPDWFRAAYAYVVDTRDFFDEVSYGERYQKIHDVAERFKNDYVRKKETGTSNGYIGGVQAQRGTGLYRPS